MEISTRSQIPGTVVEVHQGEVMPTVKMDIGNGVMVTAAVRATAGPGQISLPGQPTLSGSALRGS